MQEWITSVLLALLIIIPCWLALSRRREVQRQVQSWPELEQRTGLIFDSNILNFPKNYERPGLRGEYRGRYLSMALITIGDSESNTFLIYQNTSISLYVRNNAHYTLSIREKKLADYFHKIPEASNEDQDFDGRFNVTGVPREYVRRVVNLIVRSDPGLLEWMMRSLPSIELKGESLVCKQNAELVNVDEQINLLNLLCGLAELAEQTGNESANLNARRN